ncbi:MAG TPA: DUF5985 family protein [Burkholderiales bacterium]|jgi:uncharacterized membrane protein HdeD (DUF308 family)|nr:DUF5985 family protein [Burkholderiales bacterium]
MGSLLLGAIAMASLVAALFFLRFWKQTRDRFFLLFAIAFALDAVHRVTLGLSHFSEEDEPLFYLARLITFGLIIAAIIDKNWIKKRKR